MALSEEKEIQFQGLASQLVHLLEVGKIAGQAVLVTDVDCDEIFWLVSVLPCPKASKHQALKKEAL